MNRLLTAVVLLLVAGSALAAGNDALSQTSAFASNLAPPETDYSVAYLSQIFGTVGNVLQGTSGQILGKMFEIFNKGMLVVAALWLTYTTISLALHATYGNLSQKTNVALIFLRIALGFSLIIPSSTTGYSLLQDIFMKVVVEGVGLADQTWDEALKYINYGGQLYIPPENLQTSSSIISDALGQKSAAGPATQIFQDEVCMLKSQEWEQQAHDSIKQSSSQGGSALLVASPSAQPYRVVYTNDQTGVIYFPGVGNPTDKGMDYYNLTSPSGDPHTAHCGVAMDHYYVSTNGGKNPVTTTTAGAATAGQISAMQSYSYSALKQLVLSLMPVAKSYVNPPKEQSDQAGQAAIDAKTAFSAILAYTNLITPYQNILVNTNAQNASFIPKAEAEGWIMAGSFYWNVEQANNISTTISISNLLPETPALPSDGPVMQSHKSAMDSVIVVFKNFGPALTALWEQYVGAQQNSANVAQPTSSSTSGFAGSMASSNAEAVRSAAEHFGLQNTSHYNPISTLMDEGHTLISTVVDMWVGALVATGALALGAAVCSSTSPVYLFASTVISWIKSILMLISTALLLPAAILSFYVPLYPYAVFTFAAVGWFLIVIEGMIAAPLVCVGLTHPEGHDFLGKAEQALMLFLSIFIRPALMVVGLVAAMVVSFVAFHMFIRGFGAIMSSLASTPGNVLSTTSGGFTYTITFAVVMVVFGLMTMELIEQCFKLVFQLPNQIMAWIGGPQTGQDYGQMAAGVKGAVSSAASGLGEGAKGIDQANQAVVGAIAKGKEKAEGAAKKASGDIPTHGGNESGE